MNNNIVRAWKDEFYRQSLSDEERAQLPENPVGELELTEAELESVFAAGQEFVRPTLDWRYCGNSFRGDCFTKTHEYACVHRVTFFPSECYHTYRCPR